MINTLKEEKEDFCQADYNTPQEAKRQLYALLTNIITDESGYVISEAIGKAKVRLAKLEEMEGQVNNYKSIAGTKKVIKDRLVKEMEVTKKALTDLLKEELANLAEPEGDVDKDKVIRDTIKRLNYYLQEDKLPTPKEGEREKQDDPNIYTNELQALSQQAQEKF